MSRLQSFWAIFLNDNKAPVLSSNMKQSVKNFRLSGGVGIFCIGLLAALPLSGCNKETEELVEVIRPVRVIQLDARGNQGLKSFSGVSKAGLEIETSFRVSGTITDLKVKLGDQVKKGDIIAILDSRDIALEIERARAGLARAEATARRAEADFERATKLYESNSTSKADLDVASSSKDAARADVNASRKELELTESHRSDHTLRAQADGAIASVPVEVNENVQAGQTIAVLNAGDRAEVRVAIPESLIGSLQQGAEAKVHFDSIPEEDFTGTVAHVGVAASEAATTFPIKIRMDKADERVRAGLAAVVTIQLGKKDDSPRLWVKPQYIVQESNEKFVFVAEKDSSGKLIAKKQVVTTGLPSQLGIDVTGGLKGGETLIIAGLGKLHDGTPIKFLAADEPKYAQERLQGEIPPSQADLDKAIKANSNQDSASSAAKPGADEANPSAATSASPAGK